jgi:iron complex outermembrane receptor protein
MVILKIYLGGVMDRKTHFSTFSALVAPMSTIVLLGAPLSASQIAVAADTVASADGAADQGALEEIVVTAEKRSSTVQHTALDVQVFNAATLQDEGIEDFSTLYKLAPNVSVNSGGTGGVGATVISIDGIHAYNLSPVTQSPIAVNLDGVYLARMTGLTGMFYDVTRMEVLAGPQGTLYGRNATGGAVNIVTNQPGKDFGAYGEVEAGNYGESRVEGALNLPLSDTFSLRFAGRDYQHKGYFSNGLNDAHEDGGRVSFLWNLTSKATLSGSVDNEASNDHGNGYGLIGVRNLSATPNPGGGYTINPGASVPVPSNPYTNTSTLYPQGIGNSTNNSEVYGARIQFDYDLDFANLTAITGYRSMTDYDVFLQPPSPLVGGAVGTQSFPSVSKTYSTELRLASASITPLQWVAGLYGFKEVASGKICVQGVYTDPACVYQEGMDNDSISYALFGQATYTPPVDDDKIHVVAGARYNSDEVTSSNFEYAVFPLLYGNIDDLHLNKTSKKGTYKIGLNYDLTPDNLLYISNSTGYRAFNFQYGHEPYVPPETIKAYDIGSKNEFFGHRLQVNLDAFWYDYYGSERSEQSYPPAFLPFLPFGDITSFSVGHLRYKGVSLDSAVAITPVDRIRFAAQYIDAKYLNFVIPAIYKNTTPENSLGIPTGQAVGVFSGDPIGEVSPLAGSMGYEHDWHVLDGTVTGKLDGQFSTRTPMTDADPGTLEDVERPAFVEGDVLFRYAPSSDRWSVSLWCRNFTNKIIWNSAGYGLTSGTAEGGIVTALLNPPRTYGITLTGKVGNP